MDSFEGKETEGGGTWIGSEKFKMFKPFNAFKRFERFKRLKLWFMAWRPIHLVTLFLPFVFLSGTSLDPHEVTNREYMQFVQATGHPIPEYWTNGRYPTDMENEPVVLVNWHDAVSYCRWAGGKRLPTVDEWTQACKTGLKKRGNVWEWTSTDIPTGDQTFKALCGPMDSCDCSHRYLAEWKNEVKGFRCAQGSAFLSWLPLLFRQNVLFKPDSSAFQKFSQCGNLLIPWIFLEPGQRDPTRFNG